MRVAFKQFARSTDIAILDNLTTVLRNYNNYINRCPKLQFLLIKLSVFSYDCAIVNYSFRGVQGVTISDLESNFSTLISQPTDEIFNHMRKTQGLLIYNPKGKVDISSVIPDAITQDELLYIDLNRLSDPNGPMDPNPIKIRCSLSGPSISSRLNYRTII